MTVPVLLPRRGRGHKAKQALVALVMTVALLAFIVIAVVDLLSVHRHY